MYSAVMPSYGSNKKSLDKEKEKVHRVNGDDKSNIADIERFGND